MSEAPDPVQALAAAPGTALAAELPGLELLLAATGLPAALVYAGLLAFARIGTALMLLPGFGEAWVPPRIRLGLGLALSVLVLPAVFPVLPVVPDAPADAALQLGHEVLMGAVLGFSARLVVSAAMVAGSIVALQTGLANALQPNVVTPDATTTLGVFLGLATIAFMVNSGLDHLLLGAVVRSYDVLPATGSGPWVPADLDRLAGLVARIAADALALGLWIAMPVVVASLMLNLALGLANRFMQQLQAYFLSVPLAIGLGLGLLAAAAPAMLAAVDQGVRQAILRLGSL